MSNDAASIRLEQISAMIIADYKAGMPLLEIRKKWKVSNASIYKVVKAKNIKRPQMDYQPIIDDYNNGMHVRDIMAKHDIGSSRFYTILNKEGLRRIEPMDEDVVNAIVNEYRQGTKVDAIIASFSLYGSEPLYKVLDKKGVPRRKKGLD